MEKQQEKKSNRASVLRALLVYALFLIAGIMIVSRIFYIQAVEGKTLEERAKEQANQFRTVPAQRGKILARDGKVLVKRVVLENFSIDTYPVDKDKKPTISDSAFEIAAQGLTDSLFRFFGAKKFNCTKEQYLQKLLKARKEEKRHFRIVNEIDAQQAEVLKGFPLLSDPRCKKIEKTEVRRMPFGGLAQRTIGYIKDTLYVGIEGAFDSYLYATQGNVMHQKVGPNLWVEVENENNIHPCNGKDVVTTLDMDIQDVAQKALKDNLTKNKAKQGCVIVMEVATGDVLAVVNLSKDDQGNFTERFNSAIGTRYEMGSVFKTVAMTVALNDGKITLDDRYKVNKISESFPGRNRPITDTHGFAGGNPTVLEIFEQSSNIGTVKVIYENYKNNEQKFIDGLYKIGIQNPLDIPVSGEAMPIVKNTKDRTWSKATLTSMPMGYEVEVTPLQMITFYNAIANNGCMVKPRFVKEVRDSDFIVETFETDTLNPNICTEEALKNIRIMLEGVVKNGTGRKGFQGVSYTVAGKTGTARTLAAGGGYSSTKHNASFCGYFPADNPKYSCFVLVEEPSAGQYYAAAVALPVFRDIANKLYATDKDLMPEANHYISQDSIGFIPIRTHSKKDDLETIFNHINLNLNLDDTQSEWIVIDSGNEQVKITPKTIAKNTVPDVCGMSLTNAVYVMEEAGLSVEASGYGKVEKQSPEAGTPVESVKKVTLTLKI